MSLIHVADLVNCLQSLLQRALQGHVLPSVLNLGGPEPISIRRLADTIGHTLGISPVFEIAAEPRPCDLIADIAQLKQLVQPAFTNFEEAVRQTFSEPTANVREAA